MFRELIEVPVAGERLVPFTLRLLEHREPFIATAMSLPALDMSEDHLEHAHVILALSPQFSTFRFETCPRRCSDEKFWSAYFTLLASEVRYQKVTSRSRASSQENKSSPDSQYRPSVGRSSIGSDFGSPEVQRGKSGAGEGQWFQGLYVLLEDLDKALAEDDESTSSRGESSSANKRSASVESCSMEEALPACLEEQGCPLPSTFFVSETCRVVGSAAQSLNSSPAKPAPMSSNIDQLETVSSLRLVPWWSEETPRKSSTSIGDVANASGGSDDSFEWYC